MSDGKSTPTAEAEATSPIPMYKKSDSGSLFGGNSTAGYVIRTSTGVSPVGAVQGIQQPLILSPGGPSTAVYYASTMQNLPALQALNETATGAGFLFIEAGRFTYMGRVFVPRKVNIFAMFKESMVDLTEAQFIHPITDITVGSVFGKVRIIIPPGINVRSGGFSLFGTFSNSFLVHQDSPTSMTNRPLIVIRGLSIFAQVEVIVDNTKPPVTMVNTI